MTELLQRTITATLFTLVFLICIILGKVSFLILFFGIMVGCLWEFYGLFQESESPPMLWRGLFIAISIFLFSMLISLSLVKISFFSVLTPAMYMLAVSALFKNNKGTLISSALTLWGIFYCVIPVCLFIWVGFLSHHRYNYHLILGPILFIWFNDTGAFTFGKIFGKHRMFEKISPGKTWEGFLGGAASTLALGVFLDKIFPELNRIQWIILSVIVVFSGTMGDLVESLYKRELKIKDSGKFFPGHGGMLDRFDSFLMAAPFIYVYLVLIKS